MSGALQCGLTQVAGLSQTIEAIRDIEIVNKVEQNERDLQNYVRESLKKDVQTAATTCSIIKGVHELRYKGKR